MIDCNTKVYLFRLSSAICYELFFNSVILAKIKELRGQKYRLDLQLDDRYFLEDRKVLVNLYTDSTVTYQSTSLY